MWRVVDCGESLSGGLMKPACLRTALIPGGRQRGAHDACVVLQLRRNDLGPDVDKVQEFVSLSARAAAENDQIRPQQCLEAPVVRRQALGPLFPAEAFLLAY